MADQSLGSDKKSQKSSFSLFGKGGFLGLFGSRTVEENPNILSVNKNHANRPTLSIDVEKPSQKNSQTASKSLTLDPKAAQPKPTVSPEYPINEVLVLGEEYKMVVKIVNKKIPTSSPPNASSFVPSLKNAMHENTPTIIKQEIFSMYDKGIKAKEWHEITPENVAVHIAKRLHCNIMVDALCGFGGNTIQFAKYCDYVLSFDIDPEKTLSARHNSQIYGVHHKIDFLTVDFFQLKNLVGDVVFLGPSDMRKNSNEPFSLFKHSEPDLRDLLAKSLEISFNIALKLPGDTNLEELVKLFNVSLERDGLYSKRFCMEVERILDSNDEVNCIVVYFGDCSSIEIKQEYEAIYEYISHKETAEWKQKFPLKVFAPVLQKVGIRKFFNYIIQIEKENQKMEKQSSLFEIFLEKLVEKNIFTKASLRKLLDDEAHHPGLPSFLHTKRKSLSKFEGTLSSLSPLVIPEAEFSKSVFSKPSLFSLKSEPLIDHDTSEEIFNKHNSSPLKSIKQAGPENAENPPNYSEVSELSVSSYSVSSNYLKDYSEDFSTSSPRENPSFKLTDRVDSTPPDSFKASSFPEKASPLDNPSLRSLRSIRRGVSQPARGRATVDSRKSRKSPDAGRSRNAEILAFM